MQINHFTSIICRMQFTSHIHSEINDNNANQHIFFVNKVDVDCASFTYLCRVAGGLLFFKAISRVLSP